MRGVARVLVWGAVFAALGHAVEQIPMSIRGDSLIYQDDKIIASGNARVLYKGRELQAGQIILDTRTNQVEGAGQVAVTEGGALIKAGSFSYDLKQEQLRMRTVDTSFQPEFSAQKIFVSFRRGQNYAASGVLTGDRWSGHGINLTTCDLAAPHSWLAAKEFLYYPDDKIVAYHLTAHFWFSPLPLLYTPYYVFYTGPRRVVFTFPKIGSNAVEGQFVKTETLYFIDADNYGGVFWDAMSSKGNGSGFWQHYSWGEPGYFYFYRITEQDTRPDLPEARNSYVLRWQQRLTLGEGNQLDLEHRYRKMYLLPQGYEDSMRDTLRYQYQSGADRLTAEYNFQEDYQSKRETQGLQSSSTIGALSSRASWQKEFRRGDGYRYEALNLEESYQINSDWRYRLNPVYYRTKTQDDPYDQRLDLYTDLELNPKEKKYFDSFKIQANYYYDLDQGDVTADALAAEFVEKAPEITLKALRQDIWGQDEQSAWLSIDSSYTYGFIRESKYFAAYQQRRFFEAAKYTANFNFYKTFDLGWSKITLLESYNQAAYDTRDQHYQFSDRPYLLADWWGFFRNKLEYERTQGEGGSPFYYDDPAQYRINRGRHTAGLYHKQAAEFTVTMAKDFETLLQDDDLYNLRLDPWNNGKVKLNFSTGQSRYTALYRDLVGGLQIGQGKSFYRFNFTKDINHNYLDNAYAGKLKTASSELDFYLGQPYAETSGWNFWLSEWHFLIKNTYDFSTEYYNLNTFALGKDLHCWYMRYNYTPVRQEWFIVFSLKAFPEQEFRLTGNEDNEFNFDAFSDTLRATEVRRYE